MTLTDDVLLQAIREACGPQSAYVYDQIRRMHAEHVKAGGKGHTPRPALILERLKRLERRGKVSSTKGTGLYGYSWYVIQ
jgi:hypothetical protein